MTWYLSQFLAINVSPEISSIGRSAKSAFPVSSGDWFLCRPLRRPLTVLDQAGREGVGRTSGGAVRTRRDEIPGVQPSNQITLFGPIGADVRQLIYFW
jgi:hypothetical protein